MSFFGEFFGERNFPCTAPWKVVQLPGLLLGGNLNRVSGGFGLEVPRVSGNLVRFLLRTSVGLVVFSPRFFEKICAYKSNWRIIFTGK